MKIGAEDIELITVMDYVRFNKLDKFIWHCPNERKCTPYHGAILKRKGVKAGVSDLIIARQSNGYPGMFIELKVKGGKLSSQQSEFLYDMESEGYKTAVCWSAEETIAAIEDYLNPTAPHQ